MCVDGDNLDSRIWKNYEINMFFLFFYMDLGSKLVFMHEHVMNNQEHVKNT